MAGDISHKLAAGILVLSALMTPALAGTIYVKADAAGANDGSSWTDAFTLLQPALDAAVSSDQIWVAAGTYYPTSDYGLVAGTGEVQARLKHFRMKNGVGLYGGFAGTETALAHRNRQANVTILSGDLNGNGLDPNDAYHVFYHPTGTNLNSTAILDGFTVTGGNASNTSGDSAAGGGMYNTGSPAVANCSFVGNYANAGGGICGATTGATIANCSFIRNTAAQSGGGISNYDASGKVLECVFKGNRAVSGSGGGISCLGLQYSLTVVNCLFAGNTAGNKGGGAGLSCNYCRLANCTFACNKATKGGGGLSDQGSLSSTVANSVFWGNNVPMGFDSGYPLMAVVGPQIDYGYDVTYSDIDGGLTGTGNISSDPRFIRMPSPGSDEIWGSADDDYGDLRLRPGSPCIDAGSNAAVPAATLTDLAGNPRFALDPNVPDTGAGTPPIVDIGAYEGSTLKVSDVVLSPLGSHSYCDPQPVTVTCPTAGASIHYTTDGSQPDESDPAVANGGIVSVSRVPPTTLKAKVFKPGWEASETVSELYYKTTIIHVTTAGSDECDGLSWATAKRSITAAMDAAPAGSEVWVATGTYKPTSDYGLGLGDRGKHFRLGSGVALCGGFSGTESSLAQRDYRANPTVLSGDLNDNGADANDCWHLFYLPKSLGLDKTAILDGFTITGGNADSSSPNDSGGGLYNYGNSLTVANCTFIGNKAKYGGGMYNSVDPSARIDVKFANCLYVGNTASASGGGANSSPSGVVMTMTDCAFVANSAGTNGGGLYSACHLALARCRFAGNTALTKGGGSYSSGSWGAFVEDSVFSGNSSPLGGAAFSSSSILFFSRCTITGNAAATGPALACSGTNGSTWITNCIIWDGLNWLSNGLNMTVTYCDIEGGYAGTGNMNSYPKFIHAPSAGGDGQWGTGDDYYGDLRLGVGSPCIDTGTGASVSLVFVTDVLGKPRTIDGNGDGNAVVDIGAYERQCLTGPTGDLLNDCGVNFADYAVLVGQWAMAGCADANQWCSAADIDHSAAVDIADLALFASHWMEGI